jgi:hypothetical protein
MSKALAETFWSEQAIETLVTQTVAYLTTKAIDPYSEARVKNYIRSLLAVYLSKLLFKNDLITVTPAWIMSSPEFEAIAAGFLDYVLSRVGGIVTKQRESFYRTMAEHAYMMVLRTLLIKAKANVMIGSVGAGGSGTSGA